MGLIEALLLGIIQGLTEFLPISSTAHIRIVPELFGWPDPGASFTAVIQLGTLVAVLAYFERDLRGAFSGWLRSFRGGEAARTAEARMGWAIAAGTVPIVCAGLLFKDSIETQWRSLYVVAGALIGMGVVLFVADRFARKQRGVETVSIRDGIWVGLWQAIALVPGASRSGSTIAGALFAGFDREAAARFSFLLSVPSILAAAMLSAYSHREVFAEMLVPVVVANVAAMVSGYLSIAFLLRFLQRHGTLVFVVYRVLLGISILAMLSQGVLVPNGVR